MSVNVKELSSLTLAYLGDAVYELSIRNYLIHTNKAKPQELHNQAVTFVSATAQSAVVHKWLDEKKLTEDEIAVVRRGRNAKSNSIPKNVSVRSYRYATAFEALLGYHYLLQNKERLDNLIEDAIHFNMNLLKEEGK